MTASTSQRSRSIGRRLERWIVGLIMGLMAFAGEWIALRSVKKKGVTTPPPKTVTTRGNEIDAG